MKRVLLLLVMMLAGWCNAASAQLTVEITGGGANQFPIVVLGFAGEEALPASITDII